jgi:histidyl-tRNA synthetase
MKSQMKTADRSGAAYAVIIGSDELAAGTVTVKPLRGGGDQTVIERSTLTPYLLKVLNS